MSPGKKKSAPTLPPEIIRAYLEASQDCISLLSPKGIIEYCNPAHEKVFGYVPGELTGLRFSKLPFISKKQHASFNKLFARLVSGESLEPIQNSITRKDGERIWVSTGVTALYRDGKLFAIQTVSRDITLHKRVEEETHLHLVFEKIVSNISSRFLNMPDHLIDKEIERTLKKVCEFIGAIRGGIFLPTGDKKGFSISHEWCADPALCQKPLIQNLPVEVFSYSSSVLNKLEDVVLDTIDDLPPGASGEREWYKKHGFYPIFFVPVISKNKLVGTLGFSAEDSRSHRWPRQYGYLLRYIATIFYSALGRKEISRKLRLTRFTLDRYSESVFWLSPPEFRVIDVNPEACRSLGYKREDMLKMTLFDFEPRFPVETADALWNELKKMKNNTIESVHRKKNGKEFPVEITANVFDFEGNEYVVAFARDISARKAAEELIRKGKQEYRNIFENVVDIFYEASLDGKLLNVTPSVERITKYKQNELIGKPMEVFFFDPAAREPLLKALYEKGEVLDFELDAKDIDGSPVPCLLNTRIIFEDGKPERIVGSLIDMRHRKKAEKKIRQLSTALQQSPVSVIITDPETRILYVNDSFTRFSGMEPEKVIGRTPSDITRGQIPLNNYNDIWENVKKGDIWKGELDYVKKDGTKVWLSITVSPVLDDKNQASNFVAVLEEITERKIAEQNLRKAKDEAEKSDHLKSAFLANMSHEIRTPMNAILGFSSLLREEDLDREQSDYYIDIINSKGRDLLRIISDIIDISRIEAGDLYIKMEPVGIFQFMRGIFNEFREDTQVKDRSNLQFRLNVPDPERKAIINTDPARLKQVFVNLIQNALKFTPDGFVEVGFKLLEKNEIRFFVKDSGVGIPEEKRKIIFERFRQIDDSHTREYGGTGLGLAICKNLLDLMGSGLSLNSVEGQGSEFFFRMKYILTEIPDTSAKAGETEMAKLKLDLKGKKIMIVEDDGSSYLFLETLLNKFSPEIIWARNGKQAIEMVNKINGINLILMDIRLPEMDGMETTRMIRKKYPDLPIIAQTAYAQISDRKLALESGCSDYLSKPISPTELNKLLAKYLNPSD